MKEHFLLYGVCAAITIAAVAVTSFLKIVVCAIAQRRGKNLSGNAKEYIFTPIALLLAAGALYVWLEYYMHVEDEQLFILIVVCFSVGTMLIYWILFQPTRKAAKGVLKAIVQYFHAEPIVQTMQDIKQAADASNDSQASDLHLNAEREGEVSPTALTESASEDPTNADSEADKLRAMVEAIKKK